MEEDSKAAWWTAVDTECVFVWENGVMLCRQMGEKLLQMLLRDPGTELCWDESEPVPSEGERKKRQKGTVSFKLKLYSFTEQ